MTRSPFASTGWCFALQTNLRRRSAALRLWFRPLPSDHVTLTRAFGVTFNDTPVASPPKEMCAHLIQKFRVRVGQESISHVNDKLSPLPLANIVEKKVTLFERMYNIVVMGAGVAGLAIANKLTRRGVQGVYVLEARSESGGRVRSVYDETSEDLLYESGPWRIPTSHRRVIWMFRSLGVRLEPLQTPTPSYGCSLHSYSTSTHELPPFFFADSPTRSNKSDCVNEHS